MKARLRPIVNTRRATTIAVARFGPRPRPPRKHHAIAVGPGYGKAG